MMGKVSFHKQACNIDEKRQKETINESGEISLPENQMNEDISQVFAKAIGAELVIDSENSLNTKCSEKKPMEEFIIYV